MDAKVTGAWLLHHSLKLQQVTGGQDFNNVNAAGKAGTLLSALSSNEQTTLDRPHVEALARAANINTLFELDPLLARLKQRNLIEVSASGVDVLGVTSEKVLTHTAEVFDSLSPSPKEKASILLAEATSITPLQQKNSVEYLSDTCKLTKPESNDLLDDAEQIGLVDFEDLGGGDKVYFNGNLFRRDIMKKTQAVLASLSSEDTTKIGEVEARLKTSGCLPLDTVRRILGSSLLDKLNAISMYDICVVNNDQENIAYVTRPAAFSKFGNPFLEDALDLAKAFVSSLTYGMTRSGDVRGQIRYPRALIRALIDGRWIGPVKAIGEDYKVLELKGVVKVEPYGRGYRMKLLKKEVGEIALEVLSAGDASGLSVTKFPTASVSSFTAPERTREKTRRKQQLNNKRETRDIVMALRTGKAL